MRTLKLAKPRWSPASERIFKYLHLAPCEVEREHLLIIPDGRRADNSNTLAVGELMEFRLKRSRLREPGFCALEYGGGGSHVSGPIGGLRCFCLEHLHA